jgi:hypothetical protein
MLTLTDTHVNLQNEIGGLSVDETDNNGLERQKLNTPKVTARLWRVMKNVEGEAIAYILIETMFRNRIKVGEEIPAQKLGDTIIELDREKRLPFVYRASQERCITELERMMEEGIVALKSNKKQMESITVLPETKLAEAAEEFLQ